MKKSISVVIPNYNGRGLLEKNLPFLYAALLAVHTEYEVIVSDDCSTDDSVSFLKTQYPSVLLVENKRNLGFSGNINRGIAQSTKELVFLLNSDIQLTEDYFNPLFPYFEDESTFGVMGRIIALDSDTLQDSAKYPKYRGGSLTTTLNFLPENSSTASKIPSLFLSGANALVNRKKLLEAGSFQELFNPFYWEDVELGVKAWRLGYSCYYEHAAVCRHPTSATIGKYHKKKKVALIARRNKVLFHYLHLEGLTLVSWFLSYSLKSFFRALTFKFSYLQSIFLFLKQYPSASKEKALFKEKQKLRHTEALSLQKICAGILQEIGTVPLKTF